MQLLRSFAWRRPAVLGRFAARISKAVLWTWCRERCNWSHRELKRERTKKTTELPEGKAAFLLSTRRTAAVRSRSR